MLVFYMYVCSWFPKHSWNTIVPNPPGCLNELSFASPCNCTTSGTTRVAASAQRAGDSIAASSASATTAMVFINAILTGMSFIMLFVFWYIGRSYSYSIQHTSCIVYCTQPMQNSLYSNLSNRFAKKLFQAIFFICIATCNISLKPVGSDTLLEKLLFRTTM